MSLHVDSDRHNVSSPEVATCLVNGMVVHTEPLRKSCSAPLLFYSNLSLRTDKEQKMGTNINFFRGCPRDIP
eukprot:4823764-Amphidinium_carterae.1